MERLTETVQHNKSLFIWAHLSSVCCRNSLRPSNLQTSRCVSYVSWLPMNVQLLARRQDADYWQVKQSKYEYSKVTVPMEKSKKSFHRMNKICWRKVKIRHQSAVFRITHIWSVDIWCVRILWGEPPGSWWATAGRRGCLGIARACSHSWPRVLCKQMLGRWKQKMFFNRIQTDHTALVSL